MASPESVILPLVRDHSATLSTSPGWCVRQVAADEQSERESREDRERPVEQRRRDRLGVRRAECDERAGETDLDETDTGGRERKRS